MVRTYVVTGDPYKQHYQEILDIRDGRKPRPAAYPYVYWDLVLADGPVAGVDAAGRLPAPEFLR